MIWQEEKAQAEEEQKEVVLEQQKRQQEKKEKRAEQEEAAEMQGAVRRLCVECAITTPLSTAPIPSSSPSGSSSSSAQNCWLNDLHVAYPRWLARYCAANAATSTPTSSRRGGRGVANAAAYTVGLGAVQSVRRHEAQQQAQAQARRQLTMTLAVKAERQRQRRRRELLQQV